MLEKKLTHINIYYIYYRDKKHTIFARCHKGMDVVHKIENVKVYKEKPVDDVKIVNIDII